MKIRVKYRKLGREQAHGLAWGFIVRNKWYPGKVIEIDDQLKKFKLMKIGIHETLHILNPEMKEAEVIRQAKAITEVLYHQMKFRRVEI